MKKMIKVTVVLLLSLCFCLFGTACSFMGLVPSAIPPGPNPLPQPTLSQKYFESGKRHIEMKNYHEAVRNFKLAHYLDLSSKKTEECLRDAEIALSRVRHDIIMANIPPGITGVRYSPSAQEVCGMEIKVGQELMQLGMFSHARKAFEHGYELLWWHPYFYDPNGYYEAYFKSAIKQCDRELVAKTSKKLQEEEK